MLYDGVWVTEPPKHASNLARVMKNLKEGYAAAKCCFCGVPLCSQDQSDRDRGREQSCDSRRFVIVSRIPMKCKHDDEWTVIARSFCFLSGLYPSWSMYQTSMYPLVPKCSMHA